MVEEEVGKVNGNETSGTDEKGEAQTKQLEQQQRHHGASLGITMKNMNCDAEYILSFQELVLVQQIK